MTISFIISSTIGVVLANVELQFDAKLQTMQFVQEN